MTRRSATALGLETGVDVYAIVKIRVGGARRCGRAERASAERPLLFAPVPDFIRPSGREYLKDAREGALIETDAVICDGVRTPIGRYGGALAAVRTDDLAAIPIRALLERNPASTPPPSTRSCWAAPTRRARTTATWRAWRPFWRAFRCRCRASRSTGSAPAAWTPSASPRAGSRRAISPHRRRRRRKHDARALRDAKGGGRLFAANAVHDTTIGWRFVNPAMQEAYGIDSMPETADNVAEDFNISRADQDAFALRSQARGRPMRRVFGGDRAR
jgi:hypothetical protein